jgi:hypothetical protein
MQPLFNFQGNAALSYLTFLGSAAAGLLGMAALAFLLLTRRFEMARRLLFMSGVCAALYFMVLFGYSVASDEQAVSVGGEKYFCEVDCHQAFSIVEVERAKSVGVPPAEAAAQGEFYIVKLRVRFDERTISKRRPLDIPLYPNPKHAVIVDADGKEYRPAVEAQLALAREKGALPSLVQPIRPGDAYETEIIFDLPANVREPRLLITELDPVTLVLIGHENSFLHKKTAFQLPAPASHSAKSE